MSKSASSFLSALRILAVFSIAGLLTASSCTLVAPLTPPSPASSTLPSALPSPTATASPPLRASPTAPASSQPPQPCLPPQSSASAPLASVPYPDLPQAIAQFMDQGVTLPDLESALYERGVAVQPASASEGDLDGDGWIDRIVSIFDPASERVPPGGQFLAYLCQDGAFQLGYQQASRPGWGAPVIHSVQDLDADGHPEVILSSPRCDDQACYEDTSILNWDNSTLVNRLQGSTAGLAFPYPTLNKSAAGSIGIDFQYSQGPTNRQAIQTWTYDPASRTWQPGEPVFDPPKYRVEVLQDAELMAQKGRFPEALLYYGRVVIDITLEDFPAEDVIDQKAYYQAYARYKTFVIYELLNNHTAAEATYFELKSSTVAGSPQEPFYEMAALFKEAYLNSEAEQACAVAQQYAQDHAETILHPLASLTPDSAPLPAEAICPAIP